MFVPAPNKMYYRVLTSCVGLHHYYLAYGYAHSRTELNFAWKIAGKNFHLQKTAYKI
jgi:hypothetical protein